MTDMEPIDGEVVEVGEELIPSTAPPANLFRTDDPVDVVAQATRVADALKSVIKSRGLTARISGRDHVLVEGWTTLGSMLGVMPVVVWSRQTADGDWEARVEARTLDGRTVGAAESLCSRKEKTWAKRDDYALRSMAQTRATSKALRGPLGFVVTLAGYNATPAEEMPADEPQETQGPPFGPEIDAAERAAVMEAVMVLFGEQRNPARSFAETIKTHAGGYMPQIVGHTLIELASSLPPDLPWSPHYKGEETT